MPTDRATAPAPISTPAPTSDRTPATAVLLVATVTMGLMAGLFFAFDVSVMPGLAEGDDRTYVTAMQNINRVIENAVFGIVFAGALIVTAVGVWLEWRAGRRQVVRWVGAALALYVVALAVTMGVNIPLNDRLAQAGDPSAITDFAAVRADFESTWVAANIARTVLCTAALAALGRALLLHGRR